MKLTCFCELFGCEVHNRCNASTRCQMFFNRYCSLASVCTSGACGNSKISSSNLFILALPLCLPTFINSCFIFILVASKDLSWPAPTITLSIPKLFFFNKSEHYKWTKDLLKYQLVWEIAERLKKPPNTQNVRLLERNGRDYKTFLCWKIY